MYPTLVDRQPLHHLLESIAEALGLRWTKVPRSGGYTDHILIGTPADIAYAARSVRSWGFQHVIADLGVTKSLIVKYIWTPGEKK